MRLTLTLFVFFLLLLPAADAQVKPQGDAASAALIRLDQRWQEAIVLGDAEFIQKRTAEDFVFTHIDGTGGDTKADWVRWAKQTPRLFLERKVSNQSVELHDDVALVFGRLDVRTRGKTASDALCYAVQYVHLYGMRDGQWMFLSHRSSQNLEESHPCSTPP